MRLHTPLSPVSAILADAMKLIDQRTADGSRHFASLPQTASWTALRDSVALLSGAELLNYVNPGGIAAWIDFSFRDHRFRINAYDGRFHFFVSDPQCADLTLFQVGSHFEALLENANDEKTSATLFRPKKGDA